MTTRRYKVILTSSQPCEKYEFTRRAANPVEALLKVLRFLSMDDIHEAPFQIFVQPIGSVRP